VQKNQESPLLLQILPKTSSIWAFLALLYRGEVAVAVMIMAAACLTQCVRFGSQQQQQLAAFSSSPPSSSSSSLSRINILK
jgi:hypothetical protein